ncbi:hypothetical protein V8G54_019073 [Vigna mungo]|uniref:Uncharacterized protein n=1 Tax=Vigna mungo TaxID=3915 RepID=A0AAQ3N9U3_VIGMU
MDRSAGDGADSAEDSGSSQSYPSTLPGIPQAWILLLFISCYALTLVVPHCWKSFQLWLGSARQLFQRLQGPMEEDTLKSHFDKIIKIGQKQRFHRNQVVSNVHDI